MADALKVAQTRRDEYKKDIAKKEAEIEELKELINDLDSFIEFGEALVSDSPSETAPSEAKAQPQTADAKPTTPQQQKPRAVVTNVDDEWGADADDGNVARVLAARNA